MKAINPYLNFDGNCGDAMKFYAKALGAELQMRTYKDAGMETAPGGENRVLHARLEVGMIKDKFGVGWMFNCEVKK